MKYLTASRGQPSQRHVSVHLVELGPPARFIASCHTRGDLRWFRVESILHARLDEAEAFRPATEEAVAEFRGKSLDGYYQAGPVIECSFLVREPESRWVVNNLIDGMTVETVPDGVRIQVKTTAVGRLGRFVVGLGAAARPETKELAEAVAELARGALSQVETDTPAPLPGLHARRRASQRSRDQV